jgi:hypothetical protein
VAWSSRAASRGQELRHLIAFRVDVGTLGEKLVDEVKATVTSSHVERGPAFLQWWSGGEGVVQRVVNEVT